MAPSFLCFGELSCRPAVSASHSHPAILARTYLQLTRSLHYTRILYNVFIGSFIFFIYYHYSCYHPFLKIVNSCTRELTTLNPREESKKNIIVQFEKYTCNITILLYRFKQVISQGFMYWPHEPHSEELLYYSQFYNGF